MENKSIYQKDDIMIQIRDLKKSFHQLTVLDGINMDIKRGEVIAIIGPSGCGKSTFLRCINHLEEPTGGEIFVDGDPGCSTSDLNEFLMKRFGKQEG